MQVKLLFPIRHETTSQGSMMWYVSLDTSLYLNFDRKDYVDDYPTLKSIKLSILGFGFRVNNS
jgi:hypothetical protein